MNRSKNRLKKIARISLPLFLGTWVSLAGAASVSFLLDGDIAGSPDGVTVKGLQGRKVASGTPSANWQVMRWNSNLGQWQSDSLSVQAPLTLTPGTNLELAVPTASASQNGVLSSANFSTFSTQNLPLSGGTLTGNLTIGGSSPWRLMRGCSPGDVGAAAAYRWDSGTEFNGHCYFRFVDALNWRQAQNRCEKIGGYLATITSHDEQLMIMASPSPGLGLGSGIRNWVGLTDRGDSTAAGGSDAGGDMLWVNGEPVTYGPNNGSGVSFFSYASPTPTPVVTTTPHPVPLTGVVTGQDRIDATNTKNCLELRNNGTWNDVDCAAICYPTPCSGDIRGYICERDF